MMLNIYTKTVGEKNFKDGLVAVLQDYDPEVKDYELWPETKTDGSHQNNLEYAFNLAKNYGKGYPDIAKRFFDTVFDHYSDNDHIDYDCGVLGVSDRKIIMLAIQN